MGKNSINISSQGRIGLIGAAIVLIAAIIAGILYFGGGDDPQTGDERSDDPVSVNDLLTTFQGMVTEPEVGKPVVVRLTISAIDTAAHVIDFSYTIHGKGNLQKNKTGQIIVGQKTINFSTLGECEFYKNKRGRIVLESVKKDWKLTQI